ncbi:MAG: polysaccharide biosynthesis C-terminal domain-containing protein [Oscillospiraceae bacterium]
MTEKNYIKNTIILFASMLITKIVGALFKIPLMNLLGGTGMGYFSTAYGLYSPVFALTAAGIPTVITRITARSLARGDLSEAYNIKKTAMALFSVIGLCGTLTVALLAKPFSKHIAGSPQSFAAILCISPAVMICCVACVVRGYYEGLSDVMPSAAASAAEACSRAVFGLALSYSVIALYNNAFLEGRELFGQHFSTAEQAYEAALPYAAAGAILGVSISELFGLITLLFVDRKYKRKERFPRLCGKRCGVCLMLLREAAPIAASALVMNCVGFVDLITVTQTLEASIADNSDYYSRAFSEVLRYSGGLKGLPNFMYGSYTGIAMSIFMLIPSFAGMTEKTALPEITYAWAKKDAVQLEKSTFALFRASALISAPACIGAFSIAEPILKLLYKSRLAEVSVCLDSFYILTFGGIFMTTATALFGVFQAIDKAQVPLFLMIGSVAVKLVLNPLLLSVPSLNIAGAAAASIAGYAAMTIPGVIVLAKYIPSMKKVIFKAVIPPVLCGICCGITAKICYNLISGRVSDILSVGFSIVSGGIIYLILLIFTGCFSVSNTISGKTKKIFEKPLAKKTKIG